MNNDISWATNNRADRDREQVSEYTERIQGAGKGDKPRHILSKYEKGYDEIRWKSSK